MWPLAALVAAAALATFAVGSGFIVANDYTEMQIDPIGFLHRLNVGWVPNIYLGYHSGFMHAYATPYGWFSALLQAVQVPPAARQRALDFVVFAAVAAGAYWGIGWMAPATTRSARVCGGLAYLLNPYVAFNVGNGTSNMIAPYAALPFLTGLTALALRGRLSPLRAGILTGIVTFFGGGINVPLVAMNVIVVALYALVYLVAAPDRASVLRRLLPYAAVGGASAVVLNLYWLVPFLDYTHTFWLGGLLDESPREHSAESSFANVMRGLGQWSIFRGDDAGPWYLWAASYLTPFFSWMLWFGPLLGAAGLALRRRATVASAFFVALAAVSIPLAVGYYQGAAGLAISAPLYDFLFTKVPGFAMFRSAYKWVWPYEFAVAGLVVLAISAVQVRASLARRHATTLRWGFTGAAAVLLLVAFWPIAANKMYHPNLPLPSWTRNESQFVGNDTSHRVALFPGQYLEWYDWLDRSFQLEAQNIEKPVVGGYMTGAPAEESHVIMTRAYKLARAGDRRATDLFRAMSVDDVLQRDDYRSLMDFAFVGSWVPTDSSLAHDMLVRVLGAHPHAQDGANRLYALDGSLPQIFGTSNARLDPRPALVVTASGDYGDIARGETAVSPDDLPPSVLPVLGGALTVSRDAASLSDLAATLAASGVMRTECFMPRCALTLRSAGRYRLLVAGLSAYPSDFREAFDLPGYDFTHADGVAVPPLLRLDGAALSGANDARTWRDYGALDLAAGAHVARIRGASPTTPALVALVPESVWQARLGDVRDAFGAHAPGPALVDVETAVQAHATTFAVPVSAHYSVLASPGRVLRTTPVREAAIGAAQLTADPAFGVSGWAHPGATIELPYVPGDGMLTLNAKLMPAAWYLDPALYAWNRGSPTQWYLLRPKSRLRVFAPFSQPVRAALTLRLSNVTHAIRTFTVSVDGRLASTFSIGGGVGPLSSDAGRVPLGSERPVVKTVSLLLSPGAHDVVLRTPAIATWAASDVDPSSASGDQVVAAVAADLAFATVVPRGTATGFAQPQAHVIGREILGVDLPASRGAGDDPFAVFRLPLANDRLDGVPSIDTVASTFPGLGTEWLAVAVADDAARTRVRYRIVQNVGIGGAFSLTPSLLLPNSASDAGRRIVGVWAVLGASAHEAADAGRMLYRLHDLHVERALPAQVPDTAVGALPLTIDGRPAGATAFLSAGIHTIAARDPHRTIGTLRVRSSGVPRAQAVPLRVERLSAASFDVRTAGATAPFVLVLNESFHTEWQATVDGHVLQHVHANGFANGWVVPASSHAQVVRLRFTAQRTYLATAWLSVVGGIFCLGGLCWRRK